MKLRAKRRAASGVLPCAVALLMVGACLAQTPQEDAGPLAFRDVTATHVPQAPNLHALDVALADFDGDGDLDAALAVEGAVNRLYSNDGQGRFTWRDGAFGQRPHDTEHVRAADFDRDGHMDAIFVAEDDRVHQLCRTGRRALRRCERAVAGGERGQRAGGGRCE